MFKNQRRLRKMKKIVSLFTVLFFLAAILITGCKKEEFVSIQKDTQKEPISLTMKQKEMKKQLSNAAQVLVSVLNEKDLVTELSKLAKNSKDINAVSLKYLFNPENEENVFKSVNKENSSAFSQKFALKFRKVVNELKSTKYNGLEDFLSENNCKLYFPYREDWNLDTLTKLTIVSDPIDNDDTNTGTTIDLTGRKSIGSTLVDDDYAQTNPVLIISPENPDIIRDPNGEIIIHDGSGSSDNNDDPSDFALNYTYGFQKDDVGYRVVATAFKFVQCQASNYEGLFRGALELHISVGDVGTAGFLAANEDLISNISRADVNNSTYINYNMVIMSNWSRHEDDLPFYFYEFDNVGNSMEISLGADVSLKAKIPGIGEVGTKLTRAVKINLKQQDDIIGRLNIDRDDFVDQYIHGKELIMNNHIIAKIKVTTYQNYEPSL